MRKLCWYFFVPLVVLLLAASFAVAQTGTVKGTIADAQTGEALIGANVFLERTAFGAATDAKGEYTIQSVLVGNYTLVVSYIGYEQYRQPINVRADRTTTLDIKLMPSAVQLGGIVVTAIGTRVEREKMGVSVSSVKGSTLATVGAHDLITGIAAKAPGINTIEAASDPGAATRIVLRGARSLQNNNQPLIVIDGVPIYSGGSAGGGTGGVAASSRMSDINPDDIESIEVYKGPSAAALWGSRAANGVIAITTKSGGQTSSKKLNITVRSRSYSDELLRPWPLQKNYGQGLSGAFAFNQARSWGDPVWMRSGAADVMDRTNYQYATITQKNSQAVYDHATELFRKPLTWEYGVTVKGGDEWSDFYLDLSQLNQKGIILDNSDLNRISIRANATRRFTENIIAKASASYVKSSSNRIQQGSNVSGLLLGEYRCPPDFNNSPYFVDYISPTGAVTQKVQRTFRNSSGNPASGAGFNNPLYVIYEIPYLLTSDRMLGNVEINYDPMKWVNVLYRVGIDYYSDLTKNTFSPGDASYPTGDTYRSSGSAYQVNSDLMATAKHELNENIDGSLMVGFHLDHRESKSVSVDASRFILVDAPATFSNALDYFPGEGWSIVRSAAVYSELTVNLYKQVFLRGTGRMESASTYGPDADKSYFYPSVSAAWQFTELPFVKDFVGDGSIFSYGKLRAAFGTAANQPGAYLTKTYYVNATPGNGWGEQLSGTYYSGAAVRSTRLGNSLLKPEMTSETEFGFDLRFLNDRISLSATQYINKTTDALLNLTVPPSSGFTSRTANAAKLENTGTELQIIGEWLRIEPFSWSTTVNWSTNKNTVTDLSGVESVFLNGFTEPSSRAIQGQPLGVIYGNRWARNADGTMTLDANGFPQMAPSQGLLGDPNPTWRMGLINTFRYERLTLNVVFDFKQGGKMWNGTKNAMVSYGTDGSTDKWTTISATQASTLKNWDGKTPTEVLTATPTTKRYYKNADGSVSFRGWVGNFGKSDVIVDESYLRIGPGNGFNGPSEQAIEDGSYVKLREVSLSYTLPLRFLGMQALTVSASGRNLAIWTDYSGVDPETNLTGASNGQGLDYFNNPSVKTWTISLQVEY
jgi:TonB-linked SusC/RagA family outer membrane protein